MRTFSIPIVRTDVVGPYCPDFFVPRVERQAFGVAWLSAFGFRARGVITLRGVASSTEPL